MAQYNLLWENETWVTETMNCLLGMKTIEWNLFAREEHSLSLGDEKITFSFPQKLSTKNQMILVALLTLMQIFACI